MIHTPGCQERYQKRSNWIAQWPCYCKACDGMGMKEWYDVETGYDGEPCPNCMEKDKCPRCGEMFLSSEDEEVPCSHCGWNWGSNMDDYCPEWECWCDDY